MTLTRSLVMGRRFGMIAGAEVEVKATTGRGVLVFIVDDRGHRRYAVVPAEDLQ
jgi:hypothetical protein